MPGKAVEIRGGTGRRRVLDLHAAALVAVLGEASTTTVQVDLGGVLGELLGMSAFLVRQRGATGLDDGHDGTTPAVLRQIVAAASLLGPPARPKPAPCPGGCRGCPCQ